jgi:hypothetical protein
MVPYQMVKLYDWYDIQDAICAKMGIPEEHFRRLPNPANEYRDLWHTALGTVIPDNMRNDICVTMYESSSLEDGDWDDLKDWERPFITAYNEVMRELDPDEQGILVSFSW